MSSPQGPKSVFWQETCYYVSDSPGAPSGQYITLYSVPIDTEPAVDPMGDNVNLSGNPFPDATAIATIPYDVSSSPFLEYWLEVGRDGRLFVTISVGTGSTPPALSGNTTLYRYMRAYVYNQSTNDFTLVFDLPQLDPLFATLPAMTMVNTSMHLTHDSLALDGSYTYLFVCAFTNDTTGDVVVLYEATGHTALLNVNSYLDSTLGLGRTVVTGSAVVMAETPRGSKHLKDFIAVSGGGNPYYGFNASVYFVLVFNEDYTGYPIYYIPVINFRNVSYSSLSTPAMGVTLAYPICDTYPIDAPDAVSRNLVSFVAIGYTIDPATNIATADYAIVDGSTNKVYIGNKYACHVHPISSSYIPNLSWFVIAKPGFDSSALGARGITDDLSYYYDLQIADKYGSLGNFINEISHLTPDAVASTISDTGDIIGTRYMYGKTPVGNPNVDQILDMYYSPRLGNNFLYCSMSATGT